MFNKYNKYTGDERYYLTPKQINSIPGEYYRKSTMKKISIDSDKMQLKFSV